MGLNKDVDIENDSIYFTMAYELGIPPSEVDKMPLTRLWNMLAMLKELRKKQKGTIRKQERNWYG